MLSPLRNLTAGMRVTWDGLPERESLNRPQEFRILLIFKQSPELYNDFIEVFSVFNPVLLVDFSNGGCNE